jgi:tyrosine-protein phosphatase SIW14
MNVRPATRDVLRLAVFALPALLVLPACPTPPSNGAAPPMPGPAPTRPMARHVVAATPDDDFRPGVANFAKVSPTLWRGAQPTAEGFKNLEAAGVKTVVNLRSDHDDVPLLAGTRLAPVRIAMRAWAPHEDEVVAFLEVAQDPARAPVYVHCAQGRDRTGYCIAAWRMVVEGWSADEAIAEMEAFHFNSLWRRNKDWLRDLDVERIRKRMAEDAARGAAAGSAER